MLDLIKTKPRRLNMNAQDIIEKIKEGVVENNAANGAKFSDWRSAEQVVMEYATDEEGRSLDLGDDLFSIITEVRNWLLIQQRVEAANSGERGTDHASVMEASKKKLMGAA